MIYSGIIKDSAGNGIPGAIGTFKKNGQVIAVMQTEDGYWQIDMDNDGGLFDATNTVEFSAPGYSITGMNASQVTQTFDVTLTKNAGSNNLILFGAAGLGLVMLASGKKKRRRLSGTGIETKDLKTVALVAGGVIGINFLYNMCVKFGLCHPADNLSSTSNNFWNPNFWQTVNPNGLPYNNALTETQAKDLLSQIKDAFGLFTDNVEQVKAVFKSLHTQANASFLAWEFQKTDQSDLLTYLRNGGGALPWDGLGDKDILEINSYVNSLPKF